jgi:ABC-type nitrate/sulfonate/bicarbonate transport system substrate-binding protein
MKNIVKVAALTAIALAAVSSAALVGCKKKDNAVLTVGATPEPHAAILNLIAPDLAKEGITLKVVEFTDYITPNDAVESGQIDANFFQHVPYMESFNKEKGYRRHPRRAARPLLEKVQGARRHPRRSYHRDPERPDQRGPRAPSAPVRKAHHA